MELKDSLLASHSQQEKNSGWLGSRKRFPVRQSYPGSKMIQALLVTICLAAFPYQGSSIILESGNVNDYEVVYPQKFSPLPKGGVQNAEPETKYEDTMKYEFKVNGEPVVLHLERNKGLFAKDYSETHYSPDGRQITTIPPVQDHCYYHGYIQNDADSIAAISACNGLRGHFRHKGETYLIEPLKLSDSEAHAVYKSENVEMEDETPKICGVTHTAWESDEPIEKTSQSARTPEQNRYLRAPKFIEIFLVVDNKMYIKYTSSLSAIRTRVYELINTINTMFRIMNIHIALIGLEVWNNEDKIKVQSDVDVTLNLFGAWRNAYLLLHKSHDNAQLLTGIDFNGTTVGYGYVGTMCHPNNSIAIVQDHTERISFMASTMAHELGHNLGIHHDTASCTCGSKPCIMTAELNSHPFYKFSSCSVQEHQGYLLRDRPQCILNKPLITDIVAPAVCGNYFVEVGEECDCGSPEDCKSTCCDAATCKLQSEAQCDSEECCEECKFKTAGTECRASKHECDKAERCTGRSAECPRDRSHKNGHPCQNDQGYCYKGKCPTLTKQCSDLLGADKKVAPDVCFDNNVKGDEYFYCRRENGVNIPCEPKDVKCGSLFCTPKTSGNTITCEYIQLSDTDVAIVEPGTKCGDGMVCSNRQCVNVRTAY